MRFSPIFSVDLRRLILLLSITASLLTLINSFYVSYQVQRDLLIQQTLEAKCYPQSSNQIIRYDKNR